MNSITSGRSWVRRGLVASMLMVWGGFVVGQARAGTLDYRRVTEVELLAAMRHVNGFDPRTTTNGARFQAEVLFELVNTVADSGRLDRPMLIPREDWFRAFLVKTNSTPETAPQYIRLAFEHCQSIWVDARMDRVIAKVKKGDRPVQAMNILIWWPEEPGTKSKYSYRDTLSTPQLKVTDHRIITYRLLNFGNRFYFDKVEGMTGRPTTGLLGLLFKMIGEGRVVETGMTVSEDGLLIVRGTAKKGFTKVTATATVAPDGKSKKGIPKDRPDLKALEDLLKTPYEIDYRPFEWSVEMDRLIRDLERSK